MSKKAMWNVGVVTWLLCAEAVATTGYIQKNSGGTDTVTPIFEDAANSRIGIGTPSPAAKLDISASGDGAAVLKLSTERPWCFMQGNTGASTQLKLVSDCGGTNTNKNFIIESTGNIGLGTTNPLYKLDVQLGDIGLDGDYGIKWTGGDTYITGKDESGLSYLALGIGGTTRMYFDDLGRIGINTTSPSYEFDVTGTIRATGSMIVGSNLSVSGAATALGDLSAGCVKVGSSLCNSYKLYLGNCAGGACAYKPDGGSWSTSSDARLKQNVRPLTGALEKLAELEPVEFEWINQTDHDAFTHAGFVAQEVEGVFPRWVSEAEPAGNDRQLVGVGNTIKTLYFPHDYFAYSVRAMQELKERNDVLGERVSDLESQVWMLKRLVCLEHPEELICNQ
jgi:hypothetical protein